MGWSGLSAPRLLESFFDAGTKSEDIALVGEFWEAKQVVAVIASSKDCGMIKRTETQKLCQKSENPPVGRR
jgi:hypothetical protein